MKLSKYILLIAALSLNAIAEARDPFVPEVMIADVHYLLQDDTTATVTHSKNLKGTIVIPDTIVYDGVVFRVTEIGDKAFRKCKGAEKFVLPSSVEVIYRSAFEGTAFYEDKSNRDSDGHLYIGDCLIAVNPSKIKSSYTISDSIRVVASGAFQGADRMHKLYLSSKMTHIAPMSFWGLKNLSQVDIPSGITRIGANAFGGTSIAASVANWHDGVLYVDSCAVAVSSAVPACVEFRPGTRLIADDLMKMNRQVRQLRIPSSLRIISQSAFSDCTSLEYVAVEDGVAVLADKAFLGCNKLSKIDLPASISTIGQGCFYNCYSLKTIYLSDSLKKISSATFYHCYQLDSIKLPASLVQIESGAFNGCTKLREITFPSHLESLGEGVFFSCSSLVRVDMGNCGLKRIPRYAFKRCVALTEVIYPTPIERIDEEAFLENLMQPDPVFPDEVSIHPNAFSH